MSKILLSVTTRAGRGRSAAPHSHVFSHLQVRRVSVAFSRLAATNYAGTRTSNSRSGAAILLGIVTSLVVPARSSVALCEGQGDKGFFEKIAQKDKDGNTDWAKTVTQITEGQFWDKLAEASGEKIQHAYDTGIPSQVSYGFVCGYCSGYALKAVGKGAAVVFGLGFVSLQTLAYYGYIQIDHTRFQKDFEKAMDFNKDGKVDKDDAQIAYNKVMEILQYSLPAGSGFGGGFIAGIRTG